MTPQPDKTPVGLVFEIRHILCPVHIEPFRRTWPGPYVEFQKKLLEYIDTNKELAELAGGRHENIPIVLAQKPFCCRLSMEEMLAFYQKHLDPHLIYCVACGQAAPGGVYTLCNYWGRPRGEAPFCYACWLKRLTAKQN